MNSTLLIGRIKYLNVLPIYYPLEMGIVSHSFQFLYAPPTELNYRMHNTMLDFSPISAAEYLLHHEDYHLLRDFSIASHGAVDSVLLCAHKPIDTLNNCTIALTTESATSVLLLKLLLQVYINIDVQYVQYTPGQQIHNGSAEQSFDAVLLIGNSALEALYQKPTQYAYIYDLGALWYEWTKKPFIFAVWCTHAKRNFSTHDFTPLFEARSWSAQNMRCIYQKAKEFSYLTDTAIERYYSVLHYTLSLHELSGLQYFATLLQQYGFLTSTPIEYRFISP